MNPCIRIPFAIGVSALSILAVDIPLYRVFERTITNAKSYGNKFTGVTLTAVFTAPSGRKVNFWGFYDGDGNGGQTGNVWKLRFMPDETGAWSYTYGWSDGTPGGSGDLNCVIAGKGKGIIRVYTANPRWFAYNGTEPVFWKSYYIKPHGSITQPISWMGPNVYQKLIDKEYNHLQMAGLLPLSYMSQTFADGPANVNSVLMSNNNPGSMNLSVWRHVDEHVAWLNDRDVGVHFFEGFHGRDQMLVNFGDMTDEQQDCYARYVASRLAPYANIAGWNYTWETSGDGPEITLCNLLAKYDPWNHPCTYEDEYPAQNNYTNGAYGFAAIEDHGIDAYQGTIAAYANKPVFMSEGNDLWRSCWNADQTAIRQQAWHVTCAGGSLTWNDLPECDEGNRAADIFSLPDAVRAIDVLATVITAKVNFAGMAPSQGLLTDAQGVTYCLAEEGKNYLVYKQGGGSFRLSLKSGTFSARWIDTKNGNEQDAHGGTVNQTAAGSVAFTAPNTTTDWVLVLNGGPVSIDKQAAARRKESRIHASNRMIMLPEGVLSASLIDLAGRPVASVAAPDRVVTIPKSAAKGILVLRMSMGKGAVDAVRISIR